VKLDLDPAREVVKPRDAATLIVVRDAPGGLEVFCVERHAKSAFLGGAIVFPGGKVDASDASDAWNDVVDGGAESDRALRIAACREALEEAAILPVRGSSVDHASLVALRTEAASAKGDAALAALLRARNLRLDLASLTPLARWITPVAEARRYDTWFYLTALPANQEGVHDQRETTSSFWGRPADVLARFDRSEVQLAPPTHRTLETLLAARTCAEAREIAARASLEPICPKLVMLEGTVALVLPGDPDHDVREARVAGKSRYVMRGDRFVPEDAPR
jgi:8-oxo-dGTP pyrophosphatase MutT (NUDIX family)